MKNFGLGLFLAFGFFLLSTVSCKKINEPAEVGDELIPAVDNVNTFETTLGTNTKYAVFGDTSRFSPTDYAALGSLNDPLFGTTTANIYFNLSLPSYSIYPFGDRSTVKIDSVVLSLAYQGAYGDTAGVSAQTVSVFEITDVNFRSDTLYRFTDGDFATGQQLGSKSFTYSALKDTITLVRKNDTSRTANVIRIPLSNSFGQRLVNYDTSDAYKTDSALHTYFRGLAVKNTSVSGGNGALAYINLIDQAKTTLLVYYKATIGGVADSSSVVRFTHVSNGQANIIRRQPSGEFATYLNAGSSPEGKLYIQSAPGSYVGIKVPGLDTFKNTNRIIHRAELIVNKLPSPFEDKFPPISHLFLDRKTSSDSAYLFHNDLTFSADGFLNYASFGGVLRPDNTYRFNLTRYVQGLVTRKDANDSMRLYAPLHTFLNVPGLTTPITLSVINRIAEGRVVVAGGNYVDPALRMRLRIIYSKL